MGYFFFMSNTFPKIEHLYGVKRIERLHLQGRAFMSFPFRVVYRIEDDENETVPVRVMVSAPKKKFKKAVDRNRIKRLMRESYRLNKSKLVEFAVKNNLKLHVSFQYVSDEIMIFSEMNNKMQKALEKLIKTVSENTKIADENG